MSLTVCLTFHYLVVWLYVLPANPINLLRSEQLNAYIRPFFSQNWRLFAPLPPLYNETYLVQLRFRARSGGMFHETDWFDLSTAMLDPMHRNPLSSAAFRHRVMDGVFRAFTELEFRRRATVPEVPSRYDLHVTAVFRRLLTLFAAQVVDAADYELVAVRGRVLREPIPPFSEAETPRYRGDLPVLTFDWMPPDADVMANLASARP